MTGHYVQVDDNFFGQLVELRFTHASAEVWMKEHPRGLQTVDCVYEEVVVDGVLADCQIYAMDTDEGRARLALHCVAPDMIPAR